MCAHNFKFCFNKISKIVKYPCSFGPNLFNTNSESHELSSVRIKSIIEENYSYLRLSINATKWMVKSPCKISTYLNGKNYYIFKVE
jgi:hypothetical protein